MCRPVLCKVPTVQPFAADHTRRAHVGALSVERDAHGPSSKLGKGRQQINWPLRSGNSLHKITSKTHRLSAFCLWPTGPTAASCGPLALLFLAALEQLVVSPAPHDGGAILRSVATMLQPIGPSEWKKEASKNANGATDGDGREPERSQTSHQERRIDERRVRSSTGVNCQQLRRIASALDSSPRVTNKLHFEPCHTSCARCKSDVKAWVTIMPTNSGIGHRNPPITRKMRTAREHVMQYRRVSNACLFPGDQLLHPKCRTCCTPATQNRGTGAAPN